MSEMKQLTVVYGPAHNRQQCLVRLNGVAPDERLTPKMARQAARVAHGVGHSAIVMDELAGYGYRLYERSARKVTWESEVCSIRVSLSSDGLWGPEDPEQYDWRELEDRFGKMLHARLRYHYPNAKIMVETGSDAVEVNGTANHPQVPWVDQIIATVYQNWLVSIE